ncbi:hypothetical protein MMC17_005698 [Xylographa soralifera]|nr:hypothetical protein [Xylographa soralifera]
MAPLLDKVLIEDRVGFQVHNTRVFMGKGATPGTAYRPALPFGSGHDCRYSIAQIYGWDDGQVLSTRVRATLPGDHNAGLNAAGRGGGPWGGHGKPHGGSDDGEGTHGHGRGPTGGRPSQGQHGSQTGIMNGEDRSGLPSIKEHSRSRPSRGHHGGQVVSTNGGDRPGLLSVREYGRKPHPGGMGTSGPRGLRVRRDEGKGLPEQRSSRSDW